jgi:hypothetical protein
MGWSRCGIDRIGRETYSGISARPHPQVGGISDTQRGRDSSALWATAPFFAVLLRLRAFYEYLATLKCTSMAIVRGNQ